MHLHQPVEETKLRETLASFVGRIKQLPPVKSAVKRQWRYRKVYYLDVLDIQGQDVLFRVGCQAGTYIRKLCHDIGTATGVGAHMAELRRTKAASFSEAQAVTLQTLADAFHYYKEGDETKLREILLPIEAGVQHLAKVWVHDTAVNPLCHGMQLKLPGIVKLESDIQKDDLVAVMTLKDELVLVGQALMPSKDMLAQKGIAVKTQQVFLKIGTYPKADRA
jgi:H/ACA ribonucleoprotein complex subunit 4